MKCSHHGCDVFLEMGAPCSDPVGRQWRASPLWWQSDQMLPLLALILTHFLYFGAEFHVEKECIGYCLGV